MVPHLFALHDSAAAARPEYQPLLSPTVGLRIVHEPPRRPNLPSLVRAVLAGYHGFPEVIP